MKSRLPSLTGSCPDSSMRRVWPDCRDFRPCLDVFRSNTLPPTRSARQRDGIRSLHAVAGRVHVDDAPRSKRRRSRGAGCVVTVELREIREADVPTLFAHQADPEANAMAAFPARDEPAFREHLARVLADPTNIIRAVVSGEVLVGRDRELGRRWRTQGRLLDRPRALGQRVRNGGAPSIDHDRHSTSVVGAHRGSQRRLAARRRAVRLRARPLRAGRRPRADLRATGLSQSHIDVLRARVGPQQPGSVPPRRGCLVGPVRRFRHGDTLEIQPTQARTSGLFDRSFTVKQVDAL